MSSSSFPTFGPLVQSLRKRMRFALGDGPTWYSQPWFGETLPGMQMSLLRLLAVAQREQLELAPLIACLATEHRGHYRSKLFRLARRLDSGLSLCAALEQTPDVLLPDDVLAIQFASQSGTLCTVFDRLLDQHREDEQTRQTHFSYSSAYWMILSVVIVLVLVFMMVVIAPNFRELGDTIGLAPPAAFVVLEAVFGSPLSVAWVAIAGFFIVRIVMWFRLPRQFVSRKILARVARPVSQRRLIQLYRMLAAALEAGRPIPGAISTLARYHHDAGLRRQLLVARNEIEQGEDVWQSMAQTGVINEKQAEALKQSARIDLRAWIFKRLASQKLMAVAARSATIVSVVEPLLVLFFASLVLWICYSYFAYLVRFIEWNV